MSGVQGLGIPALGPGSRGPGGAAGTGVRKQRSQRFTVPYNPNPGQGGSGGGYARSQSSSTPSPAPPPVPPLPYLAPPPPVHAQSRSPYTIAPGPGPVDVASSLEFLASPTGMSPYPGPAFTSATAAGPAPLNSMPEGPAAPAASQGGGAGAGLQDGHATGTGSDEIIETAIVIKSIPFACPKDHLLAVMASLSLPAPFAFNYHFAPEDPTSFRGLAFANYRHPSEAAMVRAAMDGLEVMGRKLRAEFKKQLRPGEKEMIERTKAIKRMRSAQMLATNGSANGGPGPGTAPGGQSWPRRDASAPGGWSSTSATSSSSGDFSRNNNVMSFGDQAVPPVPPIPTSFIQQPYSLGPGPGPHGFGHQHYHPPYTAGGGTTTGASTTFNAGTGSYVSHTHTHTRSISNGANFPSKTSSSSSDLNHRHPAQSSSGTGADIDGGSSSVVSVSDVGTSVSQRAARVSAGEEEEDGSEVGDSDAGSGALDMNDPQTLELYSRVLLFSSDTLRDELSFSRSLSPSQRKTVHLIARRLDLEHRSLGDGERRCVIVYKKGCAPPLHDDGAGTGSAVTGRHESAAGLARMNPPRRTLRGSVSSIVLRHTASLPANSDLSSPVDALPLTGPRHHQHSGSSSGGSSSMLPSPIGTGSNGPYTQQQPHLRGKKSMPDMRYHSHSLSSVSASSVSGAAAASTAMLPSFSGSGSSALGAYNHYQQQDRGYTAGSGSSSPYDAYSTPASSPLAFVPGSGSTGEPGASRELTSSVSLGADLSGYLGVNSMYPHYGQRQQSDQPPQKRLADVAEAAFNTAPMYSDRPPTRQRPEEHSPYRAFDSGSGTADMMHGIRKSFSTMQLNGGSGGDLTAVGRPGWNEQPVGSGAPLNDFDHRAAEHDWPLDGTKTTGPRQVRRHVALPTEWTRFHQQHQHEADRPSAQALFAAESNALGHGLRSTASVGTGLGGGCGGGELAGGLEWRRRGE
ncbi:hypothetical protein JCM3774_003938 [Rhodotorula dairenensis]